MPTHNMTPYVTPHILHKNYAQSHDNETVSKRTSTHSTIHIAPPHPDRLHAVIGRDLEYFSQAGFDMEKITLKRNAPVALLYEDAIRNEGAIISATGALINFSGKKTGRSPKDKRIVYEETSKDDIWWGSVNIKMDERMSLAHLLSA
jgi:phosphoenolpyruvate carboxykinase (ATP)